MRATMCRSAKKKKKKSYADNLVSDNDGDKFVKMQEAFVLCFTNRHKQQLWRARSNTPRRLWPGYNQRHNEASREELLAAATML